MDLVSWDIALIWTCNLYCHSGCFSWAIHEVLNRRMTGLFKNLPPVQKFRAIIQRKRAAAKIKEASRAIPGSRSTLR